MKYDKPKVLIFLLSCLSCLLFIGCGGDKKDQDIKQTETIETWKMYADQPIELDWYINYSWYNTGWGDNVVSKKITEETGVTINFMAPTGNESEKMSSMVSSDTLPDLVTLGWWEPQAQEMIEKDMVYAMNELADQYDPYFYKVIDEETAKWQTKEDGNLYCYPNSSYTLSDYENYDTIGSNQNFLVRKDLYEAIGRPDMTTPKGFKNAIKKVVRMFPEIEGKPIIPIGSDEFNSNGCNSFDKYLQNFLAVPFEKDGKYYDRYTDKEYISWLKVFRELGEGGYLADDIFIDKRAQMEEKLEQGRYFCMIYQSQDILDQQKTLYKKNPASVYMAVEGPKNSAGDNPTLPGTGINGWTLTFISKNCKDPGRAITFLSYLLSEHGQKLVYLGVEGETYDLVEGEPVIRKKVRDLLDTDREEYDRIYGADDAYWMLQDNIMQMQWQQRKSEPEMQLKEWTYPYTIYTAPYDIVFKAGTDWANAYNKIQDEWGKILPKLLLSTSEKEFDLVLETFVAKRKTYNYESVMEASTAEMNRIKKKLEMD